MKREVLGIMNKLNAEHPTSNLERPMLMALRFINFKTCEPHNPPRRISL